MGMSGNEVGTGPRRREASTEHDSARVDPARERDLVFSGSGSRSIWCWAGGAGRLGMHIKDKLKLLAPRV
jgi:hypothetical protein